MQLVSLYMLLKLITGYFLLYYMLPATLGKKLDRETVGDRFFTSLIHSHVFVIIVVHLLVAFRIYESLSLMFVIAIVYFAILGYLYKTNEISPGLLFVLRLFDMSDKNIGLKVHFQHLAHVIRKKVESGFAGLVQYLRSNPIKIIIIILLFAASAFIRLKHSLIHNYFASSDPYVHLKWAKLLADQQIYVDGIYPYGYQSVISAMSTIYHFDPYYILRFLGPLSGLFIVISIYYFVKKITRDNFWAAALSVLVYFLFSFHFGFLWRQLSSLSMEYAAIFLLPGIYYFYQYLKLNQRRFLILSGETLFVTFMISPFITFALVAAFMILGLVHLKSIFHERHWLHIFSVFAAAGFTAVLPMIIALLAGKEFHTPSIQFLTDHIGQTNTNFQPDQLLATFIGNTALLLYLVIVVTMLILLTIKKPKDPVYGTMAAISFVYFIMYQAENLDLPTLIAPYRMEVAFTITASVVFALFVAGFRQLFSQKKNDPPFIQSGLVLIVISLLLYRAEWTLPEPSQYQYEEVVEAYLNIKNEFPYQLWTIISPEEYSFAIGYGWHYHLKEFMEKVDQGLENPFSTIPTPYIFVFTEKIPLHSQQPVSRQAAGSPFPETDDTNGFISGEERLILESRVYYWMEDQGVKLADVEIYMDTPRVRIYKIVQKPALLSQEGS